jgi:CRP-like cAMP-binding protein
MPIRPPQAEPNVNLLLSLLPEGEYEKVAKMLEHVEIKAGDVLWEVGDMNKFVYFPTSVVISLDYETDRGESVSIALIGRSGMAGSDIALGNIRMPDRAVAVVSGDAWRLPRRDAQDELKDCGDFQNLFTTYSIGVLKKIAQNAVCFRLHQIDKQACRLLLEISDESSSDEIALTHQRLSELLGVRRESVSITLMKLKNQDAIKCRRGGMTIIDRRKLESLACECFDMAKENFETAIDTIGAD